MGRGRSKRKKERSEVRVVDRMPRGKSEGEGEERAPGTEKEAVEEEVEVD